MHFRLLSLALWWAGASVASAQRSCNGSPNLCGRPYSGVTFVGAHDSSFVGVLPTDNQYINAAGQLAKGIRFLQAQTHKLNNGIEMCHTSCILLDAGPLSDFLAPIKSFLDQNANEVVTLLLTNQDAVPVSQFADVFRSVGLDKYAFAPSGVLPIGSWPTLGSMIDQGKRLVVLMDYHTDTSQVPYILDEFAYYFETPYDTTDPAFAQCTLDRPGGASPDGRMYIVNHFLDVELDILGEKLLIPDQVHALQTNSVASIMAQANLCNSMYKRMPNVVLLDFTSVGDPLGAQKQLNGL